MALINSPYLYTGGDERLNSRPHVQLYAQLKQREQARNDAFDEYMRNINMKINPAGMRYQDMPAFESGLKKMQEFGIQNKEALRNPRKDSGLASMKFQQLYQQQMNRIAGSKMAAEGLIPYIDVQKDPKNARLLNKDRAMKAVQSHDQPQEIQDETGEFVPNPNFKPFNPSELEFKEENFDIPKYLKNLDYIKPTEKTEEIISADPKTLMQKIKTTSKFKQEDYDKLASIGVNTYYSDPSMKQLVDQMYNDPNNKEVIKLNELFKSKFKTDIQNEGDLAAAITIAGKETTEEDIQMKPDTFSQGMARTKYTQDRIDARQRRQQDFTIARENYRNSKNATIVDEYVQSQYNDPDAKQGWVTNDGKKYEGKFVKAPKFLIDKYSVNEGTKDAPKWNDPKFFISADGKYVFPVYKYKDDKRPTGAFGVSTDTKPINMADWKIEISNDWIKNNRTANELADEFDVEGEVDESSSSMKMQKTSTQSYSNITPATYNGKKIQMGVKNGKWYNVQTGQEIK